MRTAMAMLRCRSVSAALDQLLDGVDEDLLVDDRLREVLVESGTEVLLAITGHCVGGQRDHGQRTQTLVLPDLRQYFGSIHSRQGDVEQHERRWAVSHTGERLGTRLVLVDL